MITWLTTVEPILTCNLSRRCPQPTADNPELIAYIESCGGMLLAVLGGREGPLETLFPNGSFEMAEGLYARSATMRYCNALAAGALEALGALRASPVRLCVSLRLVPARAVRRHR